MKQHDVKFIQDDSWNVGENRERRLILRTKLSDIESRFGTTDIYFTVSKNILEEANKFYKNIVENVVHNLEREEIKFNKTSNDIEYLGNRYSRISISILSEDNEKYSTFSRILSSYMDLLEWKNLSIIFKDEGKRRHYMGANLNVPPEFSITKKQTCGTLGILLPIDEKIKQDVDPSNLINTDLIAYDNGEYINIDIFISLFAINKNKIGSIYGEGSVEGYMQEFGASIIHALEKSSPVKAGYYFGCEYPYRIQSDSPVVTVSIVNHDGRMNSNANASFFHDILTELYVDNEAICKVYIYKEAKALILFDSKSEYKNVIKAEAAVFSVNNDNYGIAFKISAIGDDENPYTDFLEKHKIDSMNDIFYLSRGYY